MANQVAEIFYHVNAEKKQKIIVDANGQKGRIIFPELEKREVEVKDHRKLSVQKNFKTDSIEFFQHKTKVKSFLQNSFEEVYYRELENLLKEKLDAKEVIIFDHTVRADNSSIRPPARHAHIDYTQKSALEQLNKHVNEPEKKEWLEGHFSLLNVWRPIGNKVQSAPLGFVLPDSLSDKDLIEIDLVYPSRKGEVVGVVHNERHEWVYLSEMEPDEIVVFNMYDNLGLKPVVHSAFDLNNTKTNSIRKSIESRILIRF